MFIMTDLIVALTFFAIGYTTWSDLIVISFQSHFSFFQFTVTEAISAKQEK